jgi:signal transduction histidine kinase
METEIILIIAIMTAVIIIFIAGLFLFANQLKSRRLLHQKEKANIEKQHKLDLLNNQLQVQQQTMQYIGSEIHDSVAQKLTLATLYSRKLEYEHGHHGIAAKQANISSIINDSLEELKDLSRTLSNYNIQDKELTDLINIECRKINTAGICKIESNINYTQPLPFMVKSSVIRVVQEFIQNSLKHSGCSCINIMVAKKEEGLLVLLSDDGKGFDTVGAQSNGIGLNNMKRRIKMIGGLFNMESKIGFGTSVEIFIDNKKLFVL